MNVKNKNLKKRLKLGDIVKYKHSNGNGLLVNIDYDRFSGEYEGYIYYWWYCPPQIINFTIDHIELVHAV